jgi:hypothetical protein
LILLDQVLDLIKVEGYEPQVELGKVEVQLPLVIGKFEEATKRCGIHVVNWLSWRFVPTRLYFPVVVAHDRHKRVCAIVTKIFKIYQK